jgi:hypothetical protein
MKGKIKHKPGPKTDWEQKILTVDYNRFLKRLPEAGEE